MNNISEMKNRKNVIFRPNFLSSYFAIYFISYYIIPEKNIFYDNCMNITKSYRPGVRNMSWLFFLSMV